ncbi:MAG TPA: DUF488 domain-containing protein [Burkholderiaceae bacterium]|jgi:uncharacterized protein YeaO (DUF488 family)|nr:DUF488 domain-containing protein [Burkholderiaceae bacterium]
MLRIKRVYEPPARTDGHRVLVDRLWPRGLAKEAARLDEWLKELAPSDSLRKWFGHDPDRFVEFSARYQQELANDETRALLATLGSRARRQAVTLVYAAHDELHNNAVVLAALLKRRRTPAKPARAAKRAPRSAAKASR